MKEDTRPSEISISHLSKSFGGKKVLNDISLEIKKGDIYGILGLSGAGKSTLVRCINGLEQFDEGEIYLEGELLSSPSHKIEKEKLEHIGMIFQSFNLLDQRTVLKNVELSLEINPNRVRIKKEELRKQGILKKDKEIRKELALLALKEVGLLDKVNSYPSSLSGGQKQRVAIARTLVLNPDVILSDEATSALDPETTNSVLELLKSLNRRYGITIVMISHQLNTIESICNKVSIIDNSRIIESGTLSDVFLSPKADITRKLLYANHVNTKLSEDRLIRILFDGNVDEPLISNIVEDLHILVSIVYADTKVVEGKAYGQTLIKRPLKKEDSQRVLSYLERKGYRYEEVKNESR